MRPTPPARREPKPTVVLGVILLLALLFAGAMLAQEKSLSPAELAAIERAEGERIAVIQRAAPAVVAVYGNDRGGGGSAVLFDPAGLALTNHHVVSAAGYEGWAGLPGGRLVRWSLVGTDPGGDLAVIQLRGDGPLPAAVLARSDRVRVGDRVLAMGNPFALAEDQSPSVTLGIVSGVNRYQPGAAENTLVYGDCLQVDSSINPGNSGGPLFDARGRVIGVNGRASFQERGRVNVGLGYAISSDQVTRFLPDLLAGKLAQHGTLDAIFSNRTAGVICSAIHLDSPAARAGLKLGDRLRTFEGQPIDDANQLTNLVSTLPADWPVRLECERAERTFTVRVRLVPLPYQTAAPAPGKAPEAAVPSPGVPGKIRDAELNRAHCIRLLQQWRAQAQLSDDSRDSVGWQIEDQLLRGGEVIGRQELILSRDGAFQLSYREAGIDAGFAYDGQKFWQLTGGESSGAAKQENVELARSDALANPLAAQAFALAALVSPPAPHGGDNLRLAGGDKAAGQAAYRVEILDDDTAALCLWFSVRDDQGALSVRLLKTGPPSDDASAMVYGDWRPTAGMPLPRERRLVAGLDEHPQLEIKNIACRALTELPAGVLRNLRHEK